MIVSLLRYIGIENSTEEKKIKFIWRLTCVSILLKCWNGTQSLLSLQNLIFNCETGTAATAATAHGTCFSAFNLCHFNFFLFLSVTSIKTNFFCYFSTAEAFNLREEKKKPNRRRKNNNEWLNDRECNDIVKRHAIYYVCVELLTVYKLYLGPELEFFGKKNISNSTCSRFPPLTTFRWREPTTNIITKTIYKVNNS